jgi:GTP cyclohydrolase II
MFMKLDEKVAASLSEKSKAAEIRRVVTIPMRGGKGSFHTFRGLEDGQEHVAIAFGNWKEQASPLVRIHSECLTGDVFSSGKCDCGEQLNESIDRMQEIGGIVLYLRQEGRGIGLYNKIDAYELQSQGHDTYEANRLLGLGDDLRDYTVAAQMLTAMDVKSIRLLSNNPDKKGQLQKLGIDVQGSVNTGVFEKESNRSYLTAKIVKTGHTLRLKD